MRVGIPVSGLMGGKLGRVLARAGHEVVFSYARSKAKLQRLASASCLHANLDGKRPTRGCAVGVSRKSASVPWKIPASTRYRPRERRMWTARSEIWPHVSPAGCP